MASANELMGLGMPGELAGLLSGEPQSLTAAGAAQATAAAIRSPIVDLTATGADGAILPSTAPLNKIYVVTNNSGSTGLIYAPVGQYMNNTLNGSLSLATAKTAFFVQYKKGYWASVLTA